jgi:ABC-2 type transport system permease protein
MGTIMHTASASIKLPARLGNAGIAAVTLIKVSLEEKLVYRFDLIIGLIRTAILILVFRYLWIALYGGQATYNGVTLGQTITYAAMSMIVSPLFPNSLIQEVGARIRNGSILFDITRPMYFGNLLLFQMMGQFVATLLTSALPMFVLSFLFVEMDLPKSPVIWLAFLVSLFLGFLTAFLVDFIVSLAGFWLTETWGIFFAKWSLVDVLGGKFLPFWIFPPLAQRVVLALPFRGITYTPLAILVGEVRLARIPAELAIQALWIVILAGLGRVIYATAVRKLAIQGG